MLAHQLAKALSFYLIMTFKKKFFVDVCLLDSRCYSGECEVCVRACVCAACVCMFHRYRTDSVLLDYSHFSLQSLHVLKLDKWCQFPGTKWCQFPGRFTGWADVIAEFRI